MAEKTNIYLLAIVSIVGVVGIVVLLLHASSTVSLSTDVTGEAFSAVKTSNTLASSKTSVAGKDSVKTEETKIPGVRKVVCKGFKGTTYDCSETVTMCPESVLVNEADTNVQFSCEVDCHGQEYAGPDGTCECDVLYDTCERA